MSTDPDSAGRIAALEARVAELDAQNAELQNEMVRRGVKLSCSKVALARATLAFEQAQDELCNTQSRLVHHEKLSAIGHMAAGIAHELNTPSGAVSCARDTLSRGVDRLSSILEEAVEPAQVPRVRKLITAIESCTRVIEEGTDRMDRTVRRLSDFAQLDRAERREVDLNHCLQDCLALFAPQLPARILVRSRLAQLPAIHCDPRALNQVFMQLLENAASAIDGGGTITCETSVQADQVRISVRDSGRGIPPELLPTLFEPSFTQKDGRIGASMGLPLCARIIEDHGGFLHVESSADHGTTLHVFLPGPG